MQNRSAASLQSQIASGETSAEETTKETFALIEKSNDEIQAFLRTFADRALEKARSIDSKRKEGKPLGKLAGVPIALKDNIQLKGEITTCGSQFLSDYRSLYDATVVRLLEEEDAIIIGKTNLDEFAMGASGTHSAFAPTKNPWDTTRSPGGSSSGSAAAVSASLCPLSLGSDTGGSIRQPAALTGVLGFKPTYGRVSRYGLVAFASSFDQIGPFARTIEDIALTMEVIGKHCERDATSLNAPPTPFLDELKQPLTHGRIGVPWHFLEELEGETRKNFEESIARFKEQGMEIVDIDLSLLRTAVATYYILTSAEASTNLARFDGIRYGHRSKKATTLDEIYDESRREGFGWEVKNRILLGTFTLSSGFQDAYYSKAQKVRTLIIRQMQEAFGKCDIIAMPTAPTVAFPLDAMSDPLQEYLQDLYTTGPSLAGLPAISVPSGQSKEGLPYGLQLIGPQTHDSTVLRYAKYFLDGMEHPVGHPPGFGGKQ
ncbi:MAG: Glutamyl-tRNA(Gln) amidotransferase subunit A [Chlamydiae bacterium]|nr:Glutamyl-tRNA(Gln) amidotransferase subunit A [Chlamydiota bacterium]